MVPSTIASTDDGLLLRGLVHRPVIKSASNPVERVETRLMPVRHVDRVDLAKGRQQRSRLSRCTVQTLPCIIRQLDDLLDLEEEP